jgi:hypothetical protein
VEARDHRQGGGGMCLQTMYDNFKQTTVLAYDQPLGNSGQLASLIASTGQFRTLPKLRQIPPSGSLRPGHHNRLLTLQPYQNGSGWAI